MLEQDRAARLPGPIPRQQIERSCISDSATEQVCLSNQKCCLEGTVGVTGQSDSLCIDEPTIGDRLNGRHYRSKRALPRIRRRYDDVRDEIDVTARYCIWPGESGRRSN